MSKVNETGGSTLRRWLLTAVLDLGGAAPRTQVHTRVEQMFGGSFTAQDKAPRTGRGQEQAWKNNLDSLYDRLKKSGHMTSSHTGAPWRLTKDGLAEAHAFGPPSVDPVAEEDLLMHFKPKSGGEYLAHLKGRVLKKQLLHEPLLQAYGSALSKNGWRPITEVHPRDLELRRGTTVWVAELKIVYNGNGTEAARAALAQLQEYRHFYYSATSTVGMVAVFSEPIGSAHVELMETLSIASVWKNGAEWDGSAFATHSGLVPTTAGSLP